MDIKTTAVMAKSASRIITVTPTGQKNSVLKKMAELLDRNRK